MLSSPFDFTITWVRSFPPPVSTVSTFTCHWIPGRPPPRALSLDDRMAAASGESARTSTLPRPSVSNSSSVRNNDKSDVAQGIHDSPLRRIPRRYQRRQGAQQQKEYKDHHQLRRLNIHLQRDLIRKIGRLV